ncbi:MAG: hypothetical protein ACRDO7_16980 [Nocardioidaceae bacterium]
MKLISITLTTMLIAASAAACSSGSDPSPDDGAAAATPQAAQSSNAAVSIPDAGEFTTRIDNPYWPMRPGTRWTYRETDEGSVQRVEVVVTHRTKRIANGVTARVVRDTVTENGEIVEDTEDWYAQDSDGNIWYLGENTAEFEDGKLTTREGSFEAGVDGAEAGIMIPASPKPGMSYRQELYEGHAEDRGEVLSTEELVEAPYGFFRNALLTKDTNDLEPRVQEYKLYAKGVGPVLVVAVSGSSGREELLRMESVESPSVGTGPLGHPKG